MIFKIAVCDDEQSVFKIIKGYLDLYLISVDDDFCLDYYSSGEALLKSYAKPHTYDIIFMDIEMQGNLSGLETAQKIRELPDKDVKITILSNYPRYLQDGYHVSAHSFLIKPLKYDDFKEEMDLLIKDIKNADAIFTITTSRDNTALIHISTLMYISTSKSMTGRTKLIFHTTTDTIAATDIMKKYEDILSPKGFVSPHKGYLVNTNYIQTVGKHEIVLANQETIPLAKNTYRDFITKYMKNIFM